MKILLSYLIILISAIPAFSGYIEIEIPTRLGGDKKFLMADLYSIDTTVAKPVIFIQTPYNKGYYRILSQTPLPPQSTGMTFEFDTLNYNFVILDWRGFFANKDRDSSGYDRGLDGYDAIEWMAGQAWCNGKVGTTGGSALGQIQFQTARHKPPHLVCAIPMVKDFKTKYEHYYYDGAFREEHVANLLPLGFFNPVSIALITTNYSDNIVWKTSENLTDYSEEFEVPMLMIGGWFDHFPSDVLRAFHDIRERSAEPVRGKHKLLFGPWLHSFLGAKKQGELEYPEAEGAPVEATMKFFDYYLLGAKNGWPLEPVIKYFQMGDNEWIHTSNWYEEFYTEAEFFMHPGGALEVYPVPPSFAEYPPDTIFYNPENPSPTVGGSRFDPFKNPPIGPMDIRELVESRDDILIFETAALNQDVKLKGAAYINLFFSSDRPDTDFSVRLCDVYPDGRSMILTQGIKRARFRNSLSEEEFLEPGKIYEIQVRLEHLGVTFKKGHKIKIVISSSNWPMFQLNANAGGHPFNEEDSLIATNLVYADQSRPSKLILPIEGELLAVTDNSIEKHSLDIYPNPVSGTAVIKADLPFSAIPVVRVYSLTGELIREFAEFGLMEKGVNNLSVKLSGLAPGAYYCALHAGAYNSAGIILKY